MITILLADDEENMREIIAFNLREQGYGVIEAKNGKEALELFQKNRKKLHLALLDVMMPGINGFEVCEKIKQIDKQFPVFFMTVRNDSADRVYGLKLGAEDYLPKPFDLEELLLRVKNILSRNKTETLYEINGIKINFDTMEIILKNNEIHKLSVKETDLLHLFIKNKNTVLSREKILDAIWDNAESASYRTIDNFVLLYRKIFEKNPKTPEYFISIRGKGYLFKYQNDEK